MPKFVIVLGSETNGAVNWARAVYERVREFGPLLLGAGAERVPSLPQRRADGAKQRVGLSGALGHNPLTPTGYRKAPAACAPGLSVNWIGGEVRRFQSSSPSWTRTSNLPVNSRPLYRLSYRGSEFPQAASTSSAGRCKAISITGGGQRSNRSVGQARRQGAVEFGSGGVEEDGGIDGVILAGDVGVEDAVA